MVLGVGTAGALANQARPQRRAGTQTKFSLKAHPTVALTFDDLPAAGGLPAGDTRTAIASRLAGELRANHLKGVYGFVTASDLVNDADSQQALRVWVDAGMKIGSHTWSHPSLDNVTAAAYEREIALNEPALRQYSSGDWHWFRYPYLEEGDTTAKRYEIRHWLHAHKYRIAEVTLTFQDDDWSDPYNRCVAKNDQAGISWLMQSYLENAAEFIRLGREEELLAFGHEIPNVLLLHETVFTTLMLPRLLDLLRQDGFRISTLAKVEKNPAYARDPAPGLPADGPLTNQVLNARRIPYPPFVPEPAERLDGMCR